MRALVLAFFFGSGLSGLLYEVAWIRMAGTIIGNTTAAVGSVVAVYMAGLALGAWWGGRAADRRCGGPLLRLYAVLEGVTALSALSVPLLLAASEPLYRVLWNSVGDIAPLYGGLRVLLVGALLIVPTTAMGATLPVLSRFLSDPARPFARDAGLAYAVNTFGGVAGTLAAGFWLVPSFGLRATTVAAVAVNVAIAVAAFALSSRTAGGSLFELAEERPRRLALAVAAISGFTALVYEVAWTRSLVLSMGSTVYAFTLILAAFILGLAFGSALSARLLSRMANPLPALTAIQAATGLAAMALLPFLGDLPLRVAPLVESLREDYGRLLLAESAFIGLVVLVPAMLLGAVFPLACRLAGGTDAAVGRSVAAVYTWNTIGSIAGTAAASFLLVPAAGLSASIASAATINLLLASVLLAVFRPRLRPVAALASLACVTAGAFHGRWDARVMASGAFLYGDANSRHARDLRLDLRAYLREDTEILGRYADSYGLVTVHREKKGTLSMRVNGKTDASTGRSDAATMHLVGHVPMVHHPAPRRALVIGLGGGLTLDAVRRHPVERVECVEISPAVIRAAGHFREANGDVLADGRVRLVEGDGRNALAFGRESYDVIVSQPSNLWISGMANLFTREFFEEASARLAPGGLFCLWVHAYRLPLDDFRQVIRTFFVTFPHGSLWEVFPGSDYLLLGHRDPLKFPWEPVDRRWRETHPDATALVTHLVADASVARAAAGPGAVVTDDRCSIEYTAPRALHRDTRPEILEWLDAPRRAPSERALYEGGDMDKAARHREARRRVADAVRSYASGRTTESLGQLEAVRTSEGIDPRTQIFLDLVADDVHDAALRRIDQGDIAGAAELLRAIPAGATLYPRALLRLGELHLRLDKREEARRYFELARERDAYSYDAAAGLAWLAQTEGRDEEAAAAWRQAALLRANYAPPLVRLAECLAKLGREKEALEACREALRIDPADRRAADLERRLGGR
jgi:spermidine synthase